MKQTCITQLTRRGATLALGVCTLLAAAMVPQLAFGTTVTPTFVPGNPSCTDLGYDFGFKPQPEPPPSGVYTFPDGINTLTLDSNGTYFDWVSTLGLDAVIVKGGPNANVYEYDPEATADSGLHSPINPNNGNPYAISHIEVCYDYEVDVNKTADTSYKRTYTWTIDKSVSPDSLLLNAGESASAAYEVSVTKGFTDSDWAVSGTIAIANNTPFAATITGVSDAVSGAGAMGVNCGVSFPYAFAAGGTLNCSYSGSLPDAASRTNTATVNTSGIVGGGTATAAVVFGDPTTIEGPNEVNVTDTNGQSWGPVSDDASWTYTREFACSSNAGDYTGGRYEESYPNTAEITETKQTDSANVDLECKIPPQAALTVAKSAAADWERTWTWTIDKSADQSSLTLSTGQQFMVNYTVEVDTASTDAYKASGTITIGSLYEGGPTNVTVTDDMTFYGPVEVACVVGGTAVGSGTEVTFDIPALGEAICTFDVELVDATDRVNTATVVPNVAGINLEYTDSADVDFGEAPNTEVDECIDVSDSFAGALGTVCARDKMPASFTYSRYVGPYDVCGEYTVVNIASFVTNDSGETGSDSWTVNVSVPCVGGCTLTPGYWKTHSEYGPAPYDDTWAQLSDGADTPFFLSGQSYHEVLWTPPTGGNAYYILAHAYIAAELNFLNGGDPAAAQAAFDAATLLFDTYTPAEIAAAKGKTGNVLRAQFISLAAILDDYNNGLIGPGHCSE